MRPEEKFDFPLLSSWDYGWRLGKTAPQKHILINSEMRPKDMTVKTKI